MDWHRLKHRQTGELRYVADLSGEDLDVWEAVRIRRNRCPEPHETVCRNGIIRACPHRKRDQSHAAIVGGLSSQQRFDALMDEIEELKARVFVLEAALKDAT